MAFSWPDGVQNKTKRLISQILWTLYLDFDGAIQDSKDAPLELMKAMEGHGVEIKNAMTFRIMLPQLDGGKYGRHLTRVVIQRRTKEIRLATKMLPEDSHLPDGAGGIATDDRIDMQLFGGMAWPPRLADVEPARGTPRDTCHSPELAREQTRDSKSVVPEPAREATRDSQSIVPEPARGEPRDEHAKPQNLAREDARDSGSTNENLAREYARDGVRHQTAGGIAPDYVDLLSSADDIDSTIGRLDDELAGLLAPRADDQELGVADVVEAVTGLLAGLERLVATRPVETAPSSRSEQEWGALLTERHGLLEQLARYMRRIKDAEARLEERSKEVEGARLQMSVLAERYRQLEANNEALLKAEKAGGQHLRAAQRFIAQPPSDRPDRGRSRPNRPNGRTTGSDSKLAYSVG